MEDQFWTQLADNLVTEIALEQLRVESIRRRTLRIAVGYRLHQLWDIAVDIRRIAEFLEADTQQVGWNWVWPRWEDWALVWREDWRDWFDRSEDNRR